MGNDLWETVLELISKQVGQPVFDTWFRTSRAINEGKKWLIVSENEFAKDWLEHHYTPLIKEAIYEITNEIPEVVFTVEDKNDDKLEFIVSQIRHLNAADRAKLFQLLQEEFPLYAHYFNEHGDMANSNDMKPSSQYYKPKFKSEHTYPNRIDLIESEIEQLKNHVNELTNSLKK